jgi:hypothetical protein
MSDQDSPEHQPDMTVQTDQQRSGPREHLERAGPQAGGIRIRRRDLLVGAGATSNAATPNSATSDSNEEWTAIQTLARQYGWSV